MNVAALLDERGSDGLNLFELVACAGQVSCARSLFATARALSQPDIDAVRCEQDSPVELDSEEPESESESDFEADLPWGTYHCDPPITTIPLTASNIGQTLSICCALGHIQLLDYMLLEFALPNTGPSIEPASQSVLV